jgi:hypothetical protein
LLQICQGLQRAFNELCSHCRRLRAGAVVLDDRTGAVDDFDLFADDETVQMAGDLGAGAGINVQHHGLRLSKQAVRKSVTDHAGLVGGQEKLAATASRQAFDVVGAEVMEELHGIGPGQFDLAALGKIEDDGAVAGGVIIGRRAHRCSLFACLDSSLYECESPLLEIAFALA